jgi:hypothetical protein
MWTSPVRGIMRRGGCVQGVSACQGTQSLWLGTFPRTVDPAKCLYDANEYDVNEIYGVEYQERQKQLKL